MNKQKTKPIKMKVVSLGLALLLLFQAVGTAAPGTGEGLLPLSEISKSAKSVRGELQLPLELGKIQAKNTGSNPQIIIHIQDLHVNEGAQIKIARIIDHLASQKGIRLVQVEGASGELYHEPLSLYPQTKARRLTAKGLLREGVITGPEFAAVAKNPHLILYGIENGELYDKNREALLKAVQTQEGSAVVLDGLRKNLDKLSRSIFPKAVQVWLDTKSAYEKEQVSILNYLRFFEEQFKQAGMEFLYPQTLRLFEMEKNEKEIREKETLKSEEEISLILEKEFLKGPVVDGGLFQEIKKMEERFAEHFIQSDSQKKLFGLYQVFDVYRKMFALALTRESVDFFYENRHLFYSGTIYETLQTLATRFSVAESLGVVDYALLDRTKDLYVSFYEFALARDDALVSNALSSLKEYKQNVSILVTGGFHTPAIEKKLAQEGVSFYTISPSIEGEIDSRKDQIKYFDAMSLTKGRVAELLEAKDSLLQLQIPSRFPTKDLFKQGTPPVSVRDLLGKGPQMATLFDMMMQMGINGLRFQPQVSPAAMREMSKRLNPSGQLLAGVYQRFYAGDVLTSSPDALNGNAVIPYSDAWGFGFEVAWRKSQRLTADENTGNKNQVFSFLSPEGVEVRARFLMDAALSDLATKNLRKTIAAPKKQASVKPSPKSKLVAEPKKEKPVVQSAAVKEMSSALPPRVQILTREEAFTRSEVRCGYFDLVGPRVGTDGAALLPSRAVDDIIKSARILSGRGEQAYGVETKAVDSKGSVVLIGSKDVNPKRAVLHRRLERDIYALNDEGDQAGFKPMDDLIDAALHDRFGTSTPPSKEETHPHASEEEKGVYYDWSDSVETIEGKKRVFQVSVKHNGDNDGIRTEEDILKEHPIYAFGKEISYSDIRVEMNRILYKDYTKGDSPVIASMLALFTAKGRWPAAARLAYLMMAGSLKDSFAGLTEPEQIDKIVKGWGGIFEKEFLRHKDKVFSRQNGKWIPNRRYIEETFLPALQTKIISDPSIKKDKYLGSFSAAQLEAFTQTALFLFLHHDTNRSIQMLLASSLPSSTFGLSVNSTLEPKTKFWVAKGQPGALGHNPTTGFYLAASDPGAVFAGLNEASRFLPYNDDQGEIIQLDMNAPLKPVLKLFSMMSHRELTDAELEARWITIKDNPYVTLPVLPDESASNMKQDIADLNDVLIRLAESFEAKHRENKKKPSNRITADRFTETLVKMALKHKKERQERLQDWILQGHDIEEFPEKKNYEADIVFIAEGASFDVLMEKKRDLEIAMPGLHVEVIPANDYMAKKDSYYSGEGANFKIGPNSILFAGSQSGMTFSVVDVIRHGEVMRKNGKLKDVFIMTGSWFSVLGRSLGQEFFPDSDFSGRIFSNMSGRRYTEAATMADATDFFFTKLFMEVFRELDSRVSRGSNNYGAFNMKVTRQGMKWQEQRAKEFLNGELAQITGFGAGKKPVDSEINKHYLERGQDIANNISEQFLVKSFVRVYTFVSVALHLPIFRLVALAITGIVLLLTGMESFANVFRDMPALSLSILAIVAHITHYLDAFFYTYQDKIFTYLIRYLQGRDIRARIGPRVLAIGGPRWSLLRDYFRNALLEAPADLQLADIDGREEPGDFGHRFKDAPRGTLVLLNFNNSAHGTEDEKGIASGWKMIANQVDGVRNLGAGPHIMLSTSNPKAIKNYKFSTFATNERMDAPPADINDADRTLSARWFEELKLQVSGQVTAAEMAEALSLLRIPFYVRKSERWYAYVLEFILNPIARLYSALTRRVYDLFMQKAFRTATTNRMFTPGKGQSGLIVFTTQTVPPRENKTGKASRNIVKIAKQLTEEGLDADTPWVPELGVVSVIYAQLYDPLSTWPGNQVDQTPGPSGNDGGNGSVDKTQKPSDAGGYYYYPDGSEPTAEILRPWGRFRNSPKNGENEKRSEVRTSSVLSRSGKKNSRALLLETLERRELLNGDNFLSPSYAVLDTVPLLSREIHTAGTQQDQPIAITEKASLSSEENRILNVDGAESITYKDGKITEIRIAYLVKDTVYQISVRDFQYDTEGRPVAFNLAYFEGDKFRQFLRGNFTEYDSKGRPLVGTAGDSGIEFDFRLDPEKGKGSSVGSITQLIVKTRNEPTVVVDIHPDHVQINEESGDSDEEQVKKPEQAIQQDGGSSPVETKTTASTGPAAPEKVLGTLSSGEPEEKEEEEIVPPGITPEDALRLLQDGRQPSPGQQPTPPNTDLALREEPLPDLPIPTEPVINEAPEQELPADALSSSVVLPRKEFWELKDVLALFISAIGVLERSFVFLRSLFLKEESPEEKVQAATQVKVTLSKDRRTLTLVFPSALGDRIQNASGVAVERLVFQRTEEGFSTEDGSMTVAANAEAGEIIFTGSEKGYHFGVLTPQGKRVSLTEFLLPVDSAVISKIVAPVAPKKLLRTYFSSILQFMTFGLLGAFSLFVLLSLPSAAQAAGGFEIADLVEQSTSALVWVRQNPTPSIYWTGLLGIGAVILYVLRESSKKAARISRGAWFKRWFYRGIFLMSIITFGKFVLWLELVSMPVASLGIGILYVGAFVGYMLPIVWGWAKTILSIPFRWKPEVAAKSSIKKDIRALSGASFLTALMYLTVRLLGQTDSSEDRLAQVTAPFASAPWPAAPLAPEKKSSENKVAAAQSSFEFKNLVPLVSDPDMSKVAVPLLAQKEGTLEMHPGSGITAADWQNSGKAFRVRKGQPLLLLKRPAIEAKAAGVQKLADYLKKVHQHYDREGLYSNRLASRKDEILTKAASLLQEVENFDRSQEVDVYGVIRAPFDGWILPGHRPLGTTKAGKVASYVFPSNLLPVQPAVPATAHAWQHSNLITMPGSVTVNGKETKVRIIMLEAVPHSDGHLILPMRLESQVDGPEGEIFVWDVENNRPYPVDLRFNPASNGKAAAYSEQLPKSTLISSTLSAVAGERVSLPVNTPEEAGRLQIHVKEGEWVSRNQLVASVDQKDRKRLEALVVQGKSFLGEVEGYLTMLSNLAKAKAVPVAPPEVRVFAEQIIQVKELEARLKSVNSLAPQTGIFIGRYNAEGQAMHETPSGRIYTPQIPVTHRIEKDKVPVKIGNVVIIRRRSTGQETLGIVRNILSQLPNDGSGEDLSRYQDILIETNNDPRKLWLFEGEFALQVFYATTPDAQAWLNGQYARHERDLAASLLPANLGSLPRLPQTKLTTSPSQELTDVLLGQVVPEQVAPNLKEAKLSPEEKLEQAGKSTAPAVESESPRIREILREELNGQSRRNSMERFLQNKNIPAGDIEHLVLYGTPDVGQMGLDYLMNTKRIVDLINIHRALHAKSPNLDMTKLARAHVIELIETDKSSLDRLVDLDRDDPERGAAQEFLISMLTVENSVFKTETAKAVRKVLASNFWLTRAEKMSLAHSLESKGFQEAGHIVRNAVFVDIAQNVGWKLGQPQEGAKHIGLIERYEPGKVKISDHINSQEHDIAQDLETLHSSWVLVEPLDNLKNRLRPALYNAARKEYDQLDEATKKTPQAISLLAFAEGDVRMDHVFKQLNLNDKTVRENYFKSLTPHALERLLYMSEFSQNKKYRERRGQVIDQLLKDHSPLSQALLARVFVNAQPDLVQQLLEKDLPKAFFEEARNLKQTPGEELVIYQQALAKLSGLKNFPESQRRLALRLFLDTLSDYELNEMLQGRHAAQGMLEKAGVPESVLTSTVREQISRRATLWAIARAAEWSGLSLESQRHSPEESALKDLKTALALKGFHLERVQSAFAIGTNNHPRIFNQLMDLAEFRQGQILNGSDRSAISHIETFRYDIGLFLLMGGFLGGLIASILHQKASKALPINKRSEVRRAPDAFRQAVSSTQTINDNLRLGRELGFAFYRNQALQQGISFDGILSSVPTQLSGEFLSSTRPNAQGEIILNYRKNFHENNSPEKWIGLMLENPKIRRMTAFKDSDVSAEEWDRFKQQARQTEGFYKARIVFADDARLGDLSSFVAFRFRNEPDLKESAIQILSPRSIRADERSDYDRFLMKAATLGRETMMILGSLEPIREVGHTVTVSETLQKAFQAYEKLQASA